MQTAETVRARNSALAAVTANEKTEPPAIDGTALAKARAAESESLATVAHFKAMVEAAETAQAKITGKEEKLDTATADLDDWKHLQQAFGKNGIQALEIDAAGPEVSAICNELLAACYGSRFVVSLETTALRADNKGSKEVFELRVFDTERGTEGSADLLSGGEKVLVSEALALAIAIQNARKSAIPMQDLFRDECAGALDSDQAVRYVEMLRRAVRLGGFSRCYFVAHQPHLWPLADARITFADGQVSAELGDAAGLRPGAGLQRIGPCCDRRNPR
jgi:exonuclease SbcC